MKLTHPWSTASLALGLFFLLNISIANAAVQVPLTPERLSVYQVDAEDSSYLGKAALRLKHHMKDGYVQIEGLEFANGEIEVEVAATIDPDHDWGCVYPAAYPVFLEDEIHLYYGGSDGLHTSWRNGVFCFATLRPDGFAGYKASDVAEPATVTTTPVFDGKALLRVSADIANGGKLVVRVLGEEKQVLAESEPLASTVSDADVRWLDDRALEPIKTKRARLQFAFQAATVYSFSLEARDAQENA